MWIKRIISSIAVAGIAIGIAAPAFAYITNTFDEKPTRRSIRGDRKQNAPDVGNIAIFGGDRSAAIEGWTGRNLLPIRGSIRAAGLRNNNRHKLGAIRGGMYKSLGYIEQGDTRRTPSKENTLAKSPLPPSLIQTGSRTYLKPSRRSIRGDRDLNNYNRR